MTQPLGSWMRQPWVSFDTETTGVDTAGDLILSAAINAIHPGGVSALSWLLDWDVEIPEASAAIHGLTRQKLAEEGEPPEAVLGSVVDWLARSLNAGYALVGMNLVFDLTMLYHNCARVGIQSLDQVATIHPVVDAYVLDKYVDPYRKGKRTLTDLAALYRVPITGSAHEAATDAWTAARVAWRIGRVYPKLGEMDGSRLHLLQMEQKKLQDESFRKYLVKNNRPVDGVDGVWPVRYPEEVPS